uniref:60S ribosomal protein L36 n=1 Tax=Rhizophora mucronata TaxID=61149 RepID=A0A2P2KIT2_RHIMU
MAHFFFSPPPVDLIFRRTSDISSRFFLALLCVPNFLLATFKARLSLPTFKSSVILFSYGAKPATSLIKLLTKNTLLLVFPLRSDGRGANSLLVTICPLFNPTKRPELGCFGAITSPQVQ